MKGPFALTDVHLCPQCLEWIKAGEDVFLLEDLLGYGLDDYCHVGCAAAWETRQHEEGISC